jgi:biopolymer transport protein ExbD
MPIRIDFTPFVSVALLLIVFFVWMKRVERPNRMSIELPDDNRCYESFSTADASLFLLANNRIGFLTYRPDGLGAEFIETDYSTNGLRKQLLQLMPNKRSIILISPTPQSIFKNLVDVIDERPLQ